MLGHNHSATSGTSWVSDKGGEFKEICNHWVLVWVPISLLSTMVLVVLVGGGTSWSCSSLGWSILFMEVDFEVGGDVWVALLSFTSSCLQFLFGSGSTDDGGFGNWADDAAAGDFEVSKISEEVLLGLVDKDAPQLQEAIGGGVLVALFEAEFPFWTLDWVVINGTLCCCTSIEEPLKKERRIRYNVKGWIII